LTMTRSEHRHSSYAQRWLPLKKDTNKHTIL